MQQSLHLLILDLDRRAALAAWYGSRWLLPILSCPERARAHSYVVRWSAEQGVPGQVIGHWLGRITPAADGMDWLVVIRSSSRSCAGHAELGWIPIDRLSTSRSLLEYQQWAAATALERGALPSVPGPFGNLTWLDDVKTWIGEVVGDPDLGPITAYRVTAHEVVLGCQTRCGRVYFKGLAPDRAVEPRVTRALSMLAPDAFARTLLLENRPDDSVWWLTAECPGDVPARCASTEVLGKIAGALACAQRQVVTSAAVLEELREADLATASAWSAGLLGDSICRAAIVRAYADVIRADVPQSWIPLDLDPSNVLLDDEGGVRFIDLDDSFIGPAPLAMAVFARRCRDTSLYVLYEQAWSPRLTSVDWRAFDVAAAILEGWLGWKRVERNTARGEVHGILDLAASRIAQRLSAAVIAR